ncbi:hypothetical protein HPULCUR_001598 [Helicostylum pulchrum]|uniref:Uncharacterized protein n=1 Tax=Helicostylum pulchrum TaxID=562976 RepID=A0ABP9XN57_9FUNG
MKKHLVIFQAIIKKLDTNQFALYFEVLFKHFDIVPETFLGMIMDFSLSQRECYLKALFSSFGLDKAHAMPFLKGCYMHWKQSVQKIVSNYAIVPPSKRKLFKTLTHQVRSTTSRRVFVQSGRRILEEFPCARPRLKCWLQPSVASTVFNCHTLMKEDLHKHVSHCTENVFDNILYKSYQIYSPAVSQVEKKTTFIPLDARCGDIRPLFPFGEQHCCMELITVLFDNMSYELKEMISGFSRDCVERHYLCSETHNHARAEDHVFPTILTAGTGMRDAVSAEKSGLTTEKLDE